MKKKFSILFTISLYSILLVLSSCRNNNSTKYIEIENQAIQDILPELVDYETMSKINDIKNATLYIIDTLNSNMFAEPNLYTIDEQIEIGINQKEKKFINRLNKDFKSRELNYNFSLKGLNLNYISLNESLERELIDNEFGYLSISRIVFNNNYTKGYLYYEFYCGVTCFWGWNIQINKINGKWEVYETFSGSVA